MATSASAQQSPADFTFASIQKQFEQALGAGYRIIGCADYIEHKKCKTTERLIVNRVDIDYSMAKAKPLLQIFSKLGIRSTFFVRLHAKEYNPFSFENYRILRQIYDAGHEIGYHSEVMEGALIWGESPEDCLRRDVQTLELMIKVKVLGAASHGGLSGINNLDFWKTRRPKDFGLLYEAYDAEPEFNLFHESLYVSDSQWTSWKCYRNGVLCSGDARSLGEHVLAGEPLMYSLIHSDTFYHEHFYE